MSNNVEHFDVQEIENFIIPLTALFGKGLVMCLEEDNRVEITGDVEGFELSGRHNNNEIAVTKISYYGTWSCKWWFTFMKMLSSTTGLLKARLIWEDGTITMLEVFDGHVTERELL